MVLVVKIRTVFVGVKSAWLTAEHMTKQSDGRGTSHEGVIVADGRCVRQEREMVAGW